MTAPLRQPDDPSDQHDVEHIGPIIYGSGKAEPTPNTIKTIRLNAGRVSPLKIAQALGWTYRRLKRVAKAEHIDIRYPARHYIDDDSEEPRGA